MEIKILIVDDHAIFRKSLKRHLEQYLNFSVLGEAVDGLDGVAKAETLRPDVVLMDVSMPGLNGIDATQLISERMPKVKVLILSMNNAAEDCLRALNAGALGYILKESAAEEVAAGVLTVMTGCQFFGAGVTSRLNSDRTKLPTRAGRWRCRGNLKLYLSGFTTG